MPSGENLGQVGVLAPSPLHLVYHAIQHSTFLYSLVSHKTLWLHSCCWGGCECLKMSPAWNVPSDTERIMESQSCPSDGVQQDHEIRRAQEDREGEQTMF